MESKTLSVTDAAQMLGVSKNLAYKLVAEGNFPAPIIRLGRRIVVARAAVEKLLSGEVPRPAA